jgi:hypothetical protein
VTVSQPDFFRPGGDGVLPNGFVEWQRGLTYTVRPEILAPLRLGREYRINATVRRTIMTGIAVTYDEVYHQAAAIANARIAELRSGEQGDALYTWILAHAWFCHELGAQTLVSASITMGMVCPEDGAAKPQGENVATTAALTAHSGGSPAAFEAKHLDGTGQRHLDEMYVDFDVSDPSRAGREVTLSYGEYVATCRRLEFEPYVHRAESRARFYHSLARRPNVEKGSFAIVRREWTCLSTHQQKDPYIVVVHLWIQL